MSWREQQRRQGPRDVGKALIELKEKTMVLTTKPKPHSSPAGMRGRENGARWLAKKLAVLPMLEAADLIARYNKPPVRRRLP